MMEKPHADNLIVLAGSVSIVVVALAAGFYVWRAVRRPNHLPESETAKHSPFPLPSESGTEEAVSSADADSESPIVRPIEAKIICGKGACVDHIACFDRLISHAEAERYAREQLEELIKDRQALAARCIAARGGFCGKFRIMLYIGQDVWRVACRRRQYYDDVYTAWTSIGSSREGPPMANSFLPVDVTDMAVRLQGPYLSILCLGDIQCLNAETGKFRVVGCPADDIEDARETLLDIVHAHGWGAQTLRLLQLFPELRTLQIEVPIKNRLPLRAQITREGLFRIEEMGHRYFDRYRRYLDADNDVWLQHHQGNLTLRETRDRQAIIEKERQQFLRDLWEECQEHLTETPSAGARRAREKG